MRTILGKGVVLFHIMICVWREFMQDELRDAVVAYLKKYHLQKRALSTYMGISPQYLSDWFCKRVDYDDAKIQKIKAFISRKFC